MKRFDMKRFCLVFLLIALSCVTFVSADDEISSSPSIGTLHMSSNVAQGAGVEIPEGAELVGNLLIEYSLNNTEWYYANEAEVFVEDLGSVNDSIYLRARYYGNEPTEYNCTVEFSTTGWNRTSRSFMTSRASQSDEDYYSQLNSNSDLPISFGNLDISYSSDAAALITERSGGIRGIIQVDSSSDDSFRWTAALMILSVLLFLFRARSAEILLQRLKLHGSRASFPAVIMLQISRWK